MEHLLPDMLNKVIHPIRTEEEHNVTSFIYIGSACKKRLRFGEIACPFHRSVVRRTNGTKENIRPTTNKYQPIVYLSSPGDVVTTTTNDASELTYAAVLLLGLANNRW